MDFTNLWSIDQDITIPEVAARATVMFLLMVLMIRLAGMRSFGKGDVFDNIVTILLGSVLARGIVGATPFLSAVTAGVIILAVHKLLSSLSFYSHFAGRVVKGQWTILYEEGAFNWKNMESANITEHDIQEQLRVQLHTNSLDDIKEIYFERTGRVSFVKKEGKTRAEAAPFAAGKGS